MMMAMVMVMMLCVVCVVLLCCLTCSLPFRDSITSESAPLVGLRVSPSGSYVLLLLKGAPAELWATRQAAGEGGRYGLHRASSIDTPFS